MMPKLEKATFAAGCFWCVEAEFRMLRGVKRTRPGYTGGHFSWWLTNYLTVCLGYSGHAEAVEVTYDPAVISYGELLDVFWNIHDPTSLNRQGRDVGSQYRSAIFFHTREQETLAREAKRRLTYSGRFDRPVVTEIAPCTQLHTAEILHRPMPYVIIAWRQLRRLARAC